MRRTTASFMRGGAPTVRTVAANRNVPPRDGPLYLRPSAQPRFLRHGTTRSSGVYDTGSYTGIGDASCRRVL